MEIDIEKFAEEEGKKIAMTTENQEDTCQRLYEQYMELVEKTRMHIQVPGNKRADQKHIKPEDLEDREEIRLQLLNCKDCLDLTPGEWFKIEKR